MKLSFMWHMHQPDYRDVKGIMQMPWVFLHAIKDYYDMPWMMSRFEGVKATFNITPPLIMQLKLYYVRPQDNDKFLSLWAKDPVMLQENERKWLIKICKSSQYETMVKGLRRYEDLYAQERFNNAELIDLEVLFLLSWCGVYLRRNNAFIQELFAKEREYTSEDKALLLEELAGFVSTIFDYYASLQAQGVISLSTTPLNHPILPLLIDMHNGVRANPSTNIPKDHISLADDAKEQVERAIELFEETFGFKPQGFWPAEGAVDPKSVELLSECGVEWIATDEEILFKSLGSRNRENLYRSYKYRDMCIVFRDKALSDLIGFTYRNKRPHEASRHFMEELRRIEEAHSDPKVFVILDGENAWEFFKNNGLDFFDALYGDIQNTPWCQTLRMEDIYRLEHRTLTNLGVGSWIHGELNTWVGHSEKTRAWELIYMAKKDYEHHKSLLDQQRHKEILSHFLAAECSDWFWWYGDDHFTEFGMEFDELFRSHLIAVYDAIGITPPSDLFIPIIKEVSSQNFWLKPQSDISPEINGLHDSFFEWIGCGIIDESKIFSTMDRDRGVVKKILYGMDKNYLYFAFQAENHHIASIEEMLIIIDPINVKGSIRMENSTEASLGALRVVVACSNWIEMRIEKSAIEEREISLRFELISNANVIQTLPGFGELKIDLTHDYSQNWFI